MITLDVINTDHNIILEKPWLMQHNPKIDWRTNQVDMTNCKCRDTRIHRVWIKQEWLNMEKESDQDTSRKGVYTTINITSRVSSLVCKQKGWNTTILRGL